MKKWKWSSVYLAGLICMDMKCVKQFMVAAAMVACAGTLEAQNRGEPTVLKPGERVIVEPGRAPEKVVVEPTVVPPAVTVEKVTIEEPAGVGLPEDKDQWDVRLGFPLWFTGMDATLGVRNRSAEIDESFTDVFDVLDFMIPLNLEARKSRWLLFADGAYMKFSTNGEPRELLTGLLANVDVTSRQIGGNFGLGYAVVKTDPCVLELYVGGRYIYVDNDLSIELPLTDRQFSESKFWIDPIIGLRTQFALADWCALYIKGDVGGFAIASDLTWKVEGGFEFDVSEHFYLRLAYRHLSTDFEDDGFTFDVNMGGPLLELGFRF